MYKKIVVVERPSLINFLLVAINVRFATLERAVRRVCTRRIKILWFTVHAV